MIINIKNIENLVIPKNANPNDAGYDIIATSDPFINGDKYDDQYYNRIDYIEYHTSVFIQPEYGYHVDIRPRSSISKYNLMLKNSVGLCDGSYRGEYILRFTYIIQPEDIKMCRDDTNNFTGKIVCKINTDKIYKNNDKIGQLVITKTIPANFNLVSELNTTERNTGAFGSSDNKKSNLTSPPPEVVSNILEKYNKDNNLNGPNKYNYSDMIKKREKDFN